MSTLPMFPGAARAVASEPYPPAGILPGDILILSRRKPTFGEIVCYREFSRLRCRHMEAAENLGPQVRGFLGVVLGLYRKYDKEDSAHGPS